MGKKQVRTAVIRTAGTNCDMETAFAFESAGAASDLIHINELTARKRLLEPYQIIALPGGFTYGDDIASGKILANELKFRLEDEMRDFIRRGKLIIGICNGFQVLVKSGLLPNISGDFSAVEATLTLNDSGKFEDRWIYLKKIKNRCVWTTGIDEIIELPVAHGEGKFIPHNASVLSALKKQGLIVFRYVDKNGDDCGYPCNPNGAVEAIAAICDPGGRVFGLMPHPERHIDLFQHPTWTRKRRSSRRGYGDGFQIFKNGVEFVKKNL